MSANIRLVVCDVDGTLLQKGESRLSFDTVSAINGLEASGAVFVAASGRSVTALEKLFENVKTKAFIGSDGAVFKGTCGRILYKNPIPADSLERILTKLKCELVLYTENTAYVRGKALAEKVREAENGEVRDFDEFSTDIPVLKLALYKGENEYGARYAEANRLVRKCYSDALWCEYVAPDVNKGNALEFIQKSFGFKYEETAVFGDNYNDIEMLKNAYYSYAAGNARQEIKTLARFCTASAADEIKKITENLRKAVLK